MILDDLDDDVESVGEDSLDLGEKDPHLDFEDVLEVHADDELDFGEEEEESPVQEEEGGLEAEETESWSDDPVRMYLTQMGEIPLLSRQQEIALAKQIEINRAKFRRRALECGYVLEIAVKILRRVLDGSLPFDRTIQVSVSDRLEKNQILGRLPHNLRTVEVLIKRNRHDYQIATSRSKPMGKRRAAWRRLGQRRRRAVRLVEELGLRTQRIEPMIRVLEDFSRRVDELKARIDQHRAQ
ncbi:MAG TPA: sigma-70 factor domain-containing protein, partial [Thermoguttaceae bacterium]|nr:sigma-70 factor domain-containing protein [Thermoguttaceae bacterium]